MEGLRSLNIKNSYRTPSDSLLSGFYLPCLAEALVYRRSVGYFRSSIYLFTGPETIEFARRGGIIQIVCSPDLSSEDIQTIATSYDKRDEIVGDAIQREFQDLISRSETNTPARVLATLIATSHLDIRVAVRTDGIGLYHEKLGFFEDSFGNSVSFIGSANETLSGWSPNGNVESIEVFTNWGPQSDCHRLMTHKATIEQVWNSQDPHVISFELSPEVQKYITDHSFPDFTHALSRLGISATNSAIQPMQHQLDAIENWIANGKRGILKHATGSGKTITAMLAIKDHSFRGLPTLIVVPSRLLLLQWKVEIQKLVPDAIILLAGDGNNSWRDSGKLAAMTSSTQMSEQRVVLATMQTTSTTEFRNRLSRDLSELLLVADEVHNLGSEKHSQILEITAGYRLGLSATPQRYGDREGTNRILGYFNGVVPPEFTLSDAIEAGRLTPYQYFPHPVSLTEDEASAWEVLTHRIGREIGRSGEDAHGQRLLSERVKLLLIQRARIAKKAQQKILTGLGIVTREFAEGQRWLIYCEDQEHLYQMLDGLRTSGLAAFDYHSSMGDEKSQYLDQFRLWGGVLVSIRCLDEGIDIPEVSHALILASSQNPRQFIQRRGRVLRTAPGKSVAVIHDAIVTPSGVGNDELQASLLKTELARAMEFSKSAINQSSSALLRAICIDNGIDVDAVFEIGEEESINE